MPQISEIAYYPVKGCAGVSCPAAELTAAGPRHDRTFMVVSSGGMYRTQRGNPALATIRPEVGASGERLTLHAPSTKRLELDVRSDGDRCDVELFGAPYTAIDQGKDAVDWLAEVLGTPSRLVRAPPEHRRVTDGQTPGTAGFADSSPVTVASMSSLDALNRRIVDSGGEPVPMSRFRPNLVVDGWADPHTEDDVRSMTAGDAELAYAKLDIRCVVTTVDQQAGVKAGPEPLRTLTGYRRVSGGGVAFGVKASIVHPGTVSVGDKVTVNSWSKPDA